MQYCRKCPDAVVEIRGGVDVPQLTGCVQFYQENGCVLIVARISGLPRVSETGFFGFHIHQGGSCCGADFSKAGSHYNPTGQAHPKHAGDLPPLLACQSNAYLSVKIDRFSVNEIIGQTVVIHSDPDDFHSQLAGNAGKKIACGVIRKRQLYSKPLPLPITGTGEVLLVYFVLLGVVWRVSLMPLDDKKYDCH